MNENFSYKMKLTDEEKEILHGSKGEVMAKVMKTLCFTATRSEQRNSFP